MRSLFSLTGHHPTIQLGFWRPKAAETLVLIISNLLVSFGPFLLGICILEGPNQCQMKSMEKEVYPERMTISCVFAALRGSPNNDSVHGGGRGGGAKMIM